MSDEPEPLRLKPRPPPPAGSPPATEAPGALPPPQAPGAVQAEGLGRLRLRPRLNVPDDAAAAPEAGAAAPAPFAPAPPPPPPSPAMAPLEEPVAAADPEPAEAPIFKLRPKGVPAPSKAPAGGLPPPPAPAGAPPPPLPRAAEGEPMTEPPPERSSSSMPPMSILAAPLSPPPGALAEAPAPPGAIPRLSVGTAQGKPPVAMGPLRRVAGFLPKVGGKPPVVKPGKTAAVLRKRAALSPMAKAGLTVVAIAIGVGGFYSYRIFFPPETQDVKIKRPAVTKPIVPAEIKKPSESPSKVAVVPGQPVDKGHVAVPGQHDRDQAKLDAPASGQDAPTPTPPPPAPDITVVESVLGDTSVSKDVKEGSTPIDAGRDASPAFRTFVAGSVIGGVYQGVPSRALINGTIVREGQTVDGSLGIAFERIDAANKVIYFKDYTGAEVSKNY